jgi:transposase
MTVVERWKGEEERPRRWKHECDQSTLHVCMKITKKQLKTIAKRSELISSTYNIPMCENTTMKPLYTVNVH